MAAYVLDTNGFIVEIFDGPGAPANSTQIAPPNGAAQPLRFINGFWQMPISTTQITYTAFLSRFTSTERATLRSLQTQDANVADFMMLAQAAKYIDLSDDRVHLGLAYFVSIQVLTAERAAAILGTPVTDAERP